MPQKQDVIIPAIKPGATELNNLIQGYRLFARSEGMSPNTITLNVAALNRLKEFLETNGFTTDASRIGVREIREFIIYLRQVKAWSRHPSIRTKARGLSQNTVNCYLRSVSAFWSWLVSEEIVPFNPFTRVRIPKPQRKVIPTFSEEQIQALLSTINQSNPCTARDQTMLLVFLDTGVRVSELVNIKMEHTYLDEGMVKVLGKGAKERMVPIGKRVQRALWKYLNQNRPEPANPGDDRVFLTRGGKPLTGKVMWKLFTRHAGKAGIRGMKSSPHVFRHTFAITYLRNGGDVFSLQRILGHSSLDVVRIYVNLAQADIKAAHRRYSPTDNMRLRTR
jgi:site-specific recombinase XerD